jgi:hypothetical protein
MKFDPRKVYNFDETGIFIFQGTKGNVHNAEEKK